MYIRKKVRVLIADDHKLFRDGLIELLSDEPDIEIAGEAENGYELIEKYFSLCPDIILADISMPVLPGTKALSEIKKKDRTVKSLFLSMHDEDAYIYQVYKIGGKGLVSKNVDKEELVFAIIAVSQGNLYFGIHWTDRKLNELILKYEAISNSNKGLNNGKLTDREIEIVLLIAEDFTSNEIAEKLKLSKRTVDNHRAKIMRKLGLNTLLELISYALKYKAAKEGKDIHGI